MKLFKKLFTFRSSEAEKHLIERAPRVLVIGLHHLRLNLEDPVKMENLPVANLSVTGLAIQLNDQTKSLVPGTHLRGEIQLRDQVCPFEAKVIHQNRGVVGCAFEGEWMELRHAISEYFRLEILALQMVEVRSEMLKKDEQGKPRWIRGSDNCEIYLVTDEANHLVSFQVVFFGNMIEGGAGKPLRYGEVIEEERSEKISHKGSALLKTSSRIPPEMLEAAIRFVENSTQLDPPIRTQILKELQQP